MMSVGRHDDATTATAGVGVGRLANRISTCSEDPTAAATMTDSITTRSSDEEDSDLHMQTVG